MSTFDISLNASSDVERAFSCAPLNQVVLAGRVRKLRIPQKGNVELSVVYSADWLCTQIPQGLKKGKLGVVDCTVPEFMLGTSKIAADGAFKIALPGLGSGSRTLLAQGKIELAIRNRKSGDLIPVEPESEEWREGHGLRLATSYPDGVAFVERTLN